MLCRAPIHLVRQFSTSSCQFNVHKRTDNRSKSRVTVGDEFKLTDGRKIRFEIADNEDVELIVQDAVEGFVTHNNLLRCLDATHADIEPLLRKLIEPAVPAGGTVFAICDGNIAGLRVMSIYPRDQIVARFGPLPQPSVAPKAKFPKDFGEMVAAAPYDNFKTKQIHAFIHSLYDQLAQFLPADVNQLGFGEVLRIHGSFMDFGVAKAIYEVSEKLAREKGCDVMANVTTTRASTNIFALRKNFTAKYCLPYSKFVVNGDRPFLHPYDKCYGATINVGNLKL
uniref:O-fucosyltransferase family protein n=1 Tax=Panagrellus redivivus TaxID=6233 RepID=A0A7E4VJ43_PANRE